MSGEGGWALLLAERGQSWLKMGERWLSSKLLAAPREGERPKVSARLQLRSRGSTMACWCSHAQKSEVQRT